jgi:hypothetical protein
MLRHNEISLGQVNSELNLEDVVLELPVEIDVIAVFLQEIVLYLFISKTHSERGRRQLTVMLLGTRR